MKQCSLSSIVRIGFLCLGLCRLAVAQPPAVTTLQIDVANQRAYTLDVADPLKFATDPSAAPSLANRTFGSFEILADIVAVNGKPAKGTLVTRGNRVAMSPNSAAGSAITDVERGGMGHWHFEILQEDGRPIGTLVAIGLTGGTPPPGGPSSSAQHNMAIVGGTGAFLGARGQAGQASQPFTRPAVSVAVLSATADPANRRTQGGGTLGFVLQFIPLIRPGVVTTPSGAAVFHADQTAVSDALPARAGEVLTIQATGLGPTRPGVDPGQPFPSDTLQDVNSPLEVTVGGKSAALVKAVGWPALADTYQIDFRMPEVAGPGTTTIQLTAGWIAGPEVKIAVQ
jgi:uncharacterized protein (TIGR03437 family)